MERGKVTPLHTHPDQDEAIYVLDGEIVAHVDDAQHRVGAGGLFFAPRGVPARVHGRVGDRARPQRADARERRVLLPRGGRAGHVGGGRRRVRRTGPGCAQSPSARTASRSSVRRRSQPSGPSTRTRGREVFGLSPPALSGSRSARRELALALSPPRVCLGQLLRALLDRVQLRTIAAVSLDQPQRRGAAFSVTERPRLVRQRLKRA